METTMMTDADGTVRVEPLPGGKRRISVEPGAGHAVARRSWDTSYPLALIREIRQAVTIPVIASGGAGSVEDFAPAVGAGADAVLAASVFHFGELSIGAVKTALRAAGHPVR